MIGRIISGITASNISSAFAYVTDSPSRKTRQAIRFSRRLLRHGLLSDRPSVDSSPTSIFGSPFGRCPLSLANALYGFFVLPESLPRSAAQIGMHMANPLGSLTLLAHIRNSSASPRS